MDRFEIDETDRKLMKAVLFATRHSKWQLKKVTDISYATILRRLRKLKDYEMVVSLPEPVIRKDGKPDKRRGETWDLTLKGLTYLIVNNYLSDVELDNALKRLLDSSKYLRSLRFIMRFIHVDKYRSIVVPSLKKAINELQSKINFQHFNKEYATILFSQAIGCALLKPIEGLPIEKRSIDKMPKKTSLELTRLVKETGTKKQLWKWYKAQLKIAELDKEQAEERISHYRTILKFVRNIR